MFPSDILHRWVPRYRLSGRVSLCFGEGSERLWSEAVWASNRSSIKDDGHISGLTLRNNLSTLLRWIQPSQRPAIKGRTVEGREGGARKGGRQKRKAKGGGKGRKGYAEGGREGGMDKSRAGGKEGGREEVREGWLGGWWIYFQASAQQDER